jgi:hypothetical protein
MCGIFLTTDDNELVFIYIPVIVFKDKYNKLTYILGMFIPVNLWELQRD